MYHNRPTQIPQLPPPAKVLAGFKECPAGCYPNLVLYSAEGAHVLHPQNAFGRCIRCLTYWEVTPQGEVVNIRWGADVPPEKLPSPPPKVVLIQPAGDGNAR